MNCDQCQMLSINGAACHETGCPNARKEWNDVIQEWVKVHECRECGCTFEDGKSCCEV